MKRQRNWSNLLLWTIYLALLAVLLPHTARPFGLFEPPEKGWLNVPWGMVTAWAAAVAFVAAIAALTQRLARHIETTPRFTAGRVWLRRMSHQYLSASPAVFLVAVGVSAGQPCSSLLLALQRTQVNRDTDQAVGHHPI